MRNKIHKQSAQYFYYFSYCFYVFKCDKKKSKVDCLSIVDTTFSKRKKTNNHRTVKLKITRKRNRAVYVLIIINLLTKQFSKITTLGRIKWNLFQRWDYKFKIKKKKTESLNKQARKRTNQFCLQKKKILSGIWENKYIKWEEKNLSIFQQID